MYGTCTYTTGCVGTAHAGAPASEPTRAKRPLSLQIQQTLQSWEGAGAALGPTGRGGTSPRHRGGHRGQAKLRAAASGSHHPACARTGSWTWDKHSAAASVTVSRQAASSGALGKPATAPASPAIRTGPSRLRALPSLCPCLWESLLPPAAPCPQGPGRLPGVCVPCRGGGASDSPAPCSGLVLNAEAAEELCVGSLWPGRGQMAPQDLGTSAVSVSCEPSL